MQQGAVEFTQLQQGGVEVKKLPMFIKDAARCSRIYTAAARWSRS
jgi:hypothetical protein